MHEASVLMSEIVAHHVKDKKKIEIYDSCSGSGSLLINFAQSIAKYNDDESATKYYAQELKQNTYNLTRMNLVMRGIIPDNLNIRNGDSLEEDWPYFDEETAYNPLHVDIVLSNPPYSQKWDPLHKNSDPRFSQFGIAPKSKADFAFLLHDLYHLKPDGIMAIVLPHGVLFRGESEGRIRRNLIEKNHVDAIIGLPPKMFFGTPIATIIMILKRKRENTDILIVDASKGFTKAGTKNKLRSSDIKKIADTAIERKDIEKFSRKVSREEIRENEYNLNIPRYIDSSEDSETYDLYSTMFGGIPKAELNTHHKFWTTFPTLWNDLFKDINSHCVSLIYENIKQVVLKNSDVSKYLSLFHSKFTDLNSYLKQKLIIKNDTEALSYILLKGKDEISENLFSRLNDISLVDKYKAYQDFDNVWQIIIADHELIKKYGFGITKEVEPNITINTKDDIETEVQEGWKGCIIPFELIHKTLLKEEADTLKKKESKIDEIKASLDEIFESMTDEEKSDFEDALNKNKDDFTSTGLAKLMNETIYANIDSQEINTLNEYFSMLEAKSNKKEKEDFIKAHPNVIWLNMKANKDGTFSKSEVSSYIIILQSEYKFPEDSIEARLVNASSLLDTQKELKSEVKKEADALHLKTKKIIENLTDDQVFYLLELKWVKPIVIAMNDLPKVIIDDLIAQIKYIADKYSVTYSEIANNITETENSLVPMLESLVGNEFDMKGIKEFQKLLGDKHGQK